MRLSTQAPRLQTHRQIPWTGNSHVLLRTWEIAFCSIRLWAQSMVKATKSDIKTPLINIWTCPLAYNHSLTKAKLDSCAKSPGQRSKYSTMRVVTDGQTDGRTLLNPLSPSGFMWKSFTCFQNILNCPDQPRKWPNIETRDQWNTTITCGYSLNMVLPRAIPVKPWKSVSNTTRTSGPLYGTCKWKVWGKVIHGR